MVKLGQKFSKGSKFKHRFEFEDDLQDYNSSFQEEKCRIARQRKEFPEYYDDSYWDHE